MSTFKEVDGSTPIEFKGLAKNMTESIWLANYQYYANLIKKALINPKDKNMLEIGAGINPSASDNITTFGIKTYKNLDFLSNGNPHTIIGDITDCKQIPNSSYDFIYSADTFEHIKKPWLAAKEIERILRPEGIIFIIVPFAYRYHECPVDYWRYSPHALVSLFENCECLEANWDARNRRGPVQGDGKENDICPEDEMGTWRENWRVYYLGRKK